MTTKSAWTYCRIDAPEDTHGALKGQYERLETYAAQMGFTIFGSSQDLGSDLNPDRPACKLFWKRQKPETFRFCWWTQ